MYDKPMLSQEQVQKGMTAMLNKSNQEPDRPAIAVTDDQIELISYVRMDNCRATSQRMAISKAHTSSMSGQNSLNYAKRLKSQVRGVADMGDASLVAMQKVGGAG